LLPIHDRHLLNKRNLVGHVECLQRSDAVLKICQVAVLHFFALAAMNLAFMDFRSTSLPLR
jgi:hypothetical protein